MRVSALGVWNVRTRPRRATVRAALAVDPLAGERHAAAVGAHEPGDDVEERRLAGAVRADQGRDGAGLDRERRGVDGSDAAVVLPHLVRLEERGHSSTISSRSPNRPCGRNSMSAIRISPITTSRR